MPKTASSFKGKQENSATSDVETSLVKFYEAKSKSN